MYRPKLIPILLSVMVLCLASCHSKSKAEKEKNTSQKMTTQKSHFKPIQIPKNSKLWINYRRISQETDFKISDAEILLNFQAPETEETVSFEWQEGLSKAPKGIITLPNLENTQQITLPALWPEGELYLSTSSGIWLSSDIFATLKEQKKANLSLGLTDDAVVGDIEQIQLYTFAISQLAKEQEKWEDEKKTEIKTSDNEAMYSVKINGKTEKLSVIEAESWLGVMKIWDKPENPVILELEVGKKLSLGQLLFSPYALLKGMLDFHVKSMESAPIE